MALVRTRICASLVLSLGLWLGGCFEPAPRGPAPSTPPTVAPSPAEPSKVDAMVVDEDDVVAYRLSFPAPQTHYVEVEASYPTGGAESIEVMMAVWTPGSYLVREYARNVEDVTGPTGRLEKTAKNRWRVPTQGEDRVTIRYKVYGREMSVRTNWIEASFAVLNGAPTFIAPVEREDIVAYDVKVNLFASWDAVYAGLDPHPGGLPTRFRASSLDDLIDGPIVAGNPRVERFETGGVSHALVDIGDPDGIWDSKRAASDLERLVTAQQAFWGNVPYPRYTFFNMLVESGGGLEHKNSTLIMGSRFAQKKRKRYISWLALANHEFFHTWNVKRLRPVELGPFDYEQENHTRSLWIAEGITSYYDQLLLRRAGLITDAEFFRDLSKTIADVQSAPGRLVHPLEETSYDAWIKYYRRDENSVNSTISYYSKGMLVAWLLDVEIRRASGNTGSLDDVMRLASERYSGDEGFTPEQFRTLCAEVAGQDLASFFQRTVLTATELDYKPALTHFGLEFPKPRKKNRGDDDIHTPHPDPEAGYLGAESSDRGGQLVIRAVYRGTPAHKAGLNVEDEVIAVNNVRVDGSLGAALEIHPPGTRVELLIARRGRLSTIEVTLGDKPEASWTLKATSKDPEARLRREAWLGEKPTFP